MGKWFHPWGFRCYGREFCPGSGCFLDLGVSLMSYQGLGILCLLGCMFQVILRFGSSVSTWMCVSGNLDLGVLCLLGCVFQVIFGSSMSAWMHIPGNP